MNSHSISTPNAHTRVLLLHGGWEGHHPERIADFAAQRLLHDFDVVRSSDLEMLRPEILADFDLLVPIWTFGEITSDQESALLNAVADGMGLVAWHGFASAFLPSRPHKFLIGGQFVAHPGGEDTSYSVQFHDNDPLVDGLHEMHVRSEQYYMLVDPAVKVLASTHIVGGDRPWLAGVEMPAAWIRKWGDGRVFYCSLGHTVDILETPTMTTLLRRAIAWASHSRTPITPGTLR